MSSSSKANFARKMSAGVYHQNLFRDERRVHETIVVRDGRTASMVSTHTQTPLTSSIGSALVAALGKKK